MQPPRPPYLVKTGIIKIYVREKLDSHPPPIHVKNIRQEFLQGANLDLGEGSLD